MSTQVTNSQGVDSQATGNSREVKLIELGKNSLPYLVFTISLSLFALGFFMAFLFNLILGGSGVAVSGMIKSTLGHVLRALIYVPIIFFAVLASISAWRLFLKKDDKLAIDVRTLGFVSSVMFFFAMFAFVDNMIVAFLSIVKAGYATLDKILSFWGYGSLQLFTDSIDPLAEEVSFGEIALSVGFALVIVAYALGMIFVYSRIKNYHYVLGTVAGGGQYEREGKPPFVISFILAVFTLVAGIFAFVAGNWITGIISVAITAYFSSSAILFRMTHSYLIDKGI